MIETESRSEPYATRFSDGVQEALADTTADKGGGGAGFRPHDLLEAALATCPVRKTLSREIVFESE